MLSRHVFVLILLSVGASAVAQLALKAGMSSPAVRETLARGIGFQAIVAAFGSVWIWVGFALYFAGALIWLLVLGRIEVSLAYPFVGLGFVITALLGWWLNGDHLGAARLVGIGLVVSGVIVLSRT